MDHFSRTTVQGDIENGASRHPLMKTISPMLRPDYMIFLLGSPPTIHFLPQNSLLVLKGLEYTEELEVGSVSLVGIVNHCPVRGAGTPTVIERVIIT